MTKIFYMTRLNECVNHWFIRNGNMSKPNEDNTFYWYFKKLLNNKLWSYHNFNGGNITIYINI